LDGGSVESIGDGAISDAFAGGGDCDSCPASSREILLDAESAGVFDGTGCVSQEWNTEGYKSIVVHTSWCSDGVTWVQARHGKAGFVDIDSGRVCQYTDHGGIFKVDPQLGHTMRVYFHYSSSSCDAASVTVVGYK
jgi:hypothetical protein